MLGNETLQLVYARRAVDNPQPFCLFDVACPCLLHRGTLSVRQVGAAVLSVGLLQLPRRERVNLAYLSGATAYVLPREHTGTLLQRNIQHVVTLRGETDRKLESKRCLSHSRASGQNVQSAVLEASAQHPVHMG